MHEFITTTGKQFTAITHPEEKLAWLIRHQDKELIVAKNGAYKDYYPYDQWYVEWSDDGLSFRERLHHAVVFSRMMSISYAEGVEFVRWMKALPND